MIPDQQEQPDFDFPDIPDFPDDFEDSTDCTRSETRILPTA